MLKKPYSKPTVAFQNMFLATSVSSGCSTTMDAQFSFGSCVIFYEELGGTVFNEATDACDFVTDENLCYHIPIESSTVFES